MLRQLRFPVLAFLALLFASLWSTPAQAVICNNRYCNTMNKCAVQINGPSTWCWEATGICEWSGDCLPPEDDDPVLPT